MDAFQKTSTDITPQPIIQTFIPRSLSLTPTYCHCQELTLLSIAAPCPYLCFLFEVQQGWAGSEGEKKGARASCLSPVEMAAGCYWVSNRELFSSVWLWKPRPSPFPSSESPITSLLLNQGNDMMRIIYRSGIFFHCLSLKTQMKTTFKRM